jgi:phosphoribosyl 1,2-cyclic phosphodiesterase
MRICNLASGSKGNSTYVETDKHKILLDSGKNIKYLEEKLNELEINIKDIDYVIISHNHADHISCLTKVLKKSNAFLCAPKKMVDEIEELNDYESIIYFEDVLDLDDIQIKSFKSSHDATDSRNFILSDNASSFAYITDTGYLNQKYFKELYNLDLYLFESNHDIEMLEHGPYPEWLKKRVLSDEGHLSNNAAGFYLSKLIGPKTKEVLLIHLSETNNTPEKAMETILSTLKDYNIEFNNLCCAKQNEKSEVITL